MADDWKIERLGTRIEELDGKTRRIERYLSDRERLWAKVTERAILVGAMVTAALTAVVVADRRRR